VLVVVELREPSRDGQLVDVEAVYQCMYKCL
jgi:hypothetical protein